MAWGVDTRCPSCIHKDICTDRTELYKSLSPLTNMLNLDEPHASGKGDGTIIIACQDFSIAPQE